MSVTAIEMKSQLVAEYAAQFKESASLVVVDYRGLTVAEVTELRQQLRAEGVEFKVLKNNISRRAVTEAGFEGLGEAFVGPTAVAYSKEDVVAPARVLYNFAKEHQALELKAGVVEGKVATLEDLNSYAAIPSREGLLTMLAGGLMATVRDLSICLDLYSNEK